MFVEENLLNLLKENEDIAALVGTNVFPMRLPQRKELPAISFIFDNKERTHTLKAPDGIVEASLIVNLTTMDRLDVLTLSDAVRICLDGSSNHWDSCRLLTEKQAYEMTAEDSNILIFHITQSYKMFYQE